MTTISAPSASNLNHPVVAVGCCQAIRNFVHAIYSSIIRIFKSAIDLLLCRRSAAPIPPALITPPPAQPATQTVRAVATVFSTPVAPLPPVAAITLPVTDVAPAPAVEEDHGLPSGVEAVCSSYHLEENDPSKKIYTAMIALEIVLANLEEKMSTERLNEFVLRGNKSSEKADNSLEHLKGVIATELQAKIFVPFRGSKNNDPAQIAKIFAVLQRAQKEQKTNVGAVLLKEDGEGNWRVYLTIVGEKFYFLDLNARQGVTWIEARNADHFWQALEPARKSEEFLFFPFATNQEENT